MLLLLLKSTVCNTVLGAAGRVGMLAPMACILAGNMTTPGGPLFVWHAVKSEAWLTTTWCLAEFLEHYDADWIMSRCTKRLMHPYPSAHLRSRASQGSHIIFGKGQKVQVNTLSPRSIGAISAANDSPYALRSA